MRFTFLLAIGALVVLAVWAYGGWSPSLSRNEQTAGGFSPQGAGESKAGRAQDMPASQASDRADTQETGKRAQAITATGSGDMPLSPDQRRKIAAYFQSENKPRSFGAGQERAACH